MRNRNHKVDRNQSHFSLITINQEHAPTTLSTLFIAGIQSFLIHLRVLLCMLIMRGKKRANEGKREWERISKYPLPYINRRSYIFIAEKRRSRRCRPLATPRMTIRMKSIPSVRRHGVLRGNVFCYRTLCPVVQAPHLRNTPPILPQLRNAI